MGVQVKVTFTRTKPEIHLYSHRTPRFVEHWVRHHFPWKKIIKSFYAHNAQWGLSISTIKETAIALKDLDSNCSFYHFGRYTYYICPK